MILKKLYDSHELNARYIYTHSIFAKLKKVCLFTVRTLSPFISISNKLTTCSLQMGQLFVNLLTHKKYTFVKNEYSLLSEC